MRLKDDADIVEFLKQTMRCSHDVWLETEEDRLNLKSAITQYITIVILRKKEIRWSAEVICSEEDYPLLEKYLCK